MASEIAGVFTEDRLVQVEASEFTATDILPADICFLGCSAPNSPAFAEFERVLQGINLAGRYGGLFTEDAPEAIAWLRKICNDSDLALSPEAMSYSDIKNLGEWAKKISSGK